MTAWPYILTIGGAFFALCFIAAIVMLIIEIKDRGDIEETVIISVPITVCFLLTFVPGVIGFATHNEDHKWVSQTQHTYILPKLENGESKSYVRDGEFILYSQENGGFVETAHKIYDFVEDENVEDGKVLLIEDYNQVSEVNIYYSVWRKHYDYSGKYHINHKTLMEMRGN